MVQFGLAPTEDSLQSAPLTPEELGDGTTGPRYTVLVTLAEAATAMALQRGATGGNKKIDILYVFCEVFCTLTLIICCFLKCTVYTTVLFFHVLLVLL